jgi:hypothetical protein
MIDVRVRHDNQLDVLHRQAVPSKNLCYLALRARDAGVDQNVARVSAIRWALTMRSGRIGMRTILVDNMQSPCAWARHSPKREGTLFACPVQR